MSSSPNQVANDNPVCPGCSDSPLSIASNAMGILTFAAAVFGLILYYLEGLRNSERDIEAAARKIYVLAADIYQLQHKLSKDASRIQDPDARQQLDSIFERAIMVFQEAEEFIDGPFRFLRSGGLFHRIRYRARFVLQKEETDKMLVTLEKALSDLKSGALKVFEGVPSDTDLGLSEVKATLQEMQKETKASLEMLFDLEQEHYKLLVTELGSVNERIGKLADRLEVLEGQFGHRDNSE